MANKNLSATITIGGSLTNTFKAALGSVKTQLQGIGAEVKKLNQSNKELGSEIRTYEKLGKSVTDLKDRYAATTRAVEQLRFAQKRLADSQATYDKLTSRAGSIAKFGAGAAATGGALIGAMVPGVKDSIERENVVLAIRNSGVSKAEADSMVAAAENSKQFGISITKATETVGELRTALGSSNHAIEALPTTLKALSGLRLYDRLHHSDLASGDSARQLAKIADERGGAADAEALRNKQDWAFKAITGSGGVITAGDLLNSVRSGKGAVQSMSDESFFGDSFLQQSMGADRYGTSSSSLVSAWIGGHQKNTAFEHMHELGLLREFDKNGKRLFDRDKNGNVNKVSSDALVDAQTFLKDPQKWVDEHLTPLAQKQGVNVDDPAEVMKFVNQITSNPNAANMLLSRVRFRSNIWKDRNNVMQANGIDASDSMNKSSTAGTQEDVKARMNDAYTDLGRNVMPLYTKALTLASDALVKFNAFTKEHPKLANALIVGVTVTGAALVVLGPILGTVAAGMSIYASSQLALTAATTGAAVATEGATAATVGFGAALMATPIGWIIGGIALIAAGGLLIYKYWEPLKAFFIGFGEGLAEQFAPVMPILETVGGWAKTLFGWFTNLLTPIDKAAGLTTQFGEAGKAAAGVFTAAFSPVLFLIEKIGSGVKWAAAHMPKIGGGVAAAEGAMQYDAMGNPTGIGAPEIPPMAGAAAPSMTQTNTFNISQNPGESSEDLAKRITEMQKKRDASNNRSSMVDEVH